MKPIFFAMVDAMLEAKADRCWKYGNQVSLLLAEHHLGWWRSTWVAR